MRCGLQDGNGAGPAAGNYSAESTELRSYTLRDVVEGLAIRGSTGIPEVDHLMNLLRRVRPRVSVI